jgi:dihydroorotase
MTPQLVVRRALWKDAPVDVLVAAGHILEVLPHDARRDFEAAWVVDAPGLLLFPSLIDCHTHLREPGFEYKEDMASGLAAAAAGGFGQVLCMANTTPVNDTAAVTQLMLDKAHEAWPFGPFPRPVGALTKGLCGVELAVMGELAEAGCVAFSNDGRPVENTELFRRAVEYAWDLGKRVIDHCEDPHMALGAGVNEGAVSSRLGLPAQPDVAEAMHVARDILLAEYLDIPIHVAHVSCRKSVELLAWAKKRGVPISAETCPHYLMLTEEAVEGYNTLAKVNPPLRTKDDVLALRQALAGGVVDCLCTDHAPHAAHEKETEFEDAPCGITGLDTALSTTWAMVGRGELTRADFLRAWTTAPAAIFDLPVCAFAPGDPADFFLFDPKARWVVGPETLKSKSKNTPLLGQAMTGRVTAHFLGGKNVL